MEIKHAISIDPVVQADPGKPTEHAYQELENAHLFQCCMIQSAKQPSVFSEIFL